MKDTLNEALRISGKILLEYFSKPLDSRIKESQSSIVTEADFASDSAISALIRNNFPVHNIISEETGFTNNNSEYTWVIDPLDGTSNFAAGIPWFGILITLFRGNEPVLAGASLPVWNIVYTVEKGKGAFRNGELLPQLTDRKLKDTLFSFCVDYTDDIAFLDGGLEIYKYLVRGSRNIRSTNSLVDFIYVAEGKFGGVLNLFTKVWDIAGLGLLINEAGGIMQNADGEDIRFEISDKLAEINFPVLAGNRLIVETLKKDILKKYLT
jgi:myo-inositol-1(or 4)-monophosphatase